MHSLTLLQSHDLSRQIIKSLLTSFKSEVINFILNVPYSFLHVSEIAMTDNEVF